jgi:hypothetical protein
MVKKGTAKQAPVMTPEAVRHEPNDLPPYREFFFVISLGNRTSGRHPRFIISPFLDEVA